MNLNRQTDLRFSLLKRLSAHVQKSKLAQFVNRSGIHERKPNGQLAGGRLLEFWNVCVFWCESRLAANVVLAATYEFRRTEFWSARGAKVAGFWSEPRATASDP